MPTQSTIDVNAESSLAALFVRISFILSLKYLACNVSANWWCRFSGYNVSHFVWLIKVKVKWFCNRPVVAQRVGRGIALLFHDRGTRRGWVVSSTPWAHFTPGKDPEPILQEAGWAPGLGWMGGKSRPHRNLIPDHPARSQSLYRLSYLAHFVWLLHCKNSNDTWKSSTSLDVQNLKEGMLCHLVTIIRTNKSHYQ